MILTLREEKRISQNNLARGIMSVPQLSRLENGQTETNRIVLNALFQRLGKSLDKLELAISAEDYRVVALRSRIIQELIDKNMRAAEQSLIEYEKCIDKKEPLHMQSFLQLKAISIAKKENSIQYLTEALEITFSKWEWKNWDNVYLSMQEIEIILMISYLGIEKEKSAKKFTIGIMPKAEENIDFLKKLMFYIDTHYTDEEEKAKIYPKCAWLLGQSYYMEGKEEEAYEICEMGITSLAQNGVLTFMKELLELKILCSQKMNKEKEYIQKEKEAVEFLYQIAQKTIPENKLILFMLSSGQSELVISNELIKELRMAQSLSQDAGNIVED